MMSHGEGFYSECIDPGSDAAVRFERTTRRQWLAARAYLILLACLTIFFASLSVGWGLLSSALSLSLLSTRGTPGPAILVPITWAPWAPLLLGYSTFFILPVLSSMPVLLPWAACWRTPRCIIVFRRFNVAHLNGPLKRILTRYFAPLGHVFTLADKAIRIPWSVRVPLILGQLSFLHFRPRRVNKPVHLARLLRQINETVWLNVNWLVSYRKVFAIRSSDELWRDCVDGLLGRADLVVMDISVPSEALIWEIAECIKHNLQARAIFLLAKEYEESGHSWITQISKEFWAVSAIPVFTYSGRRLTNERAFIRHTASVLTTGAKSHASRRPLMKRFAAVFATSIVISVCSFLGCAPWMFGAITAKHSPWRWPVAQAFLYSDEPDAALNRLERDYYDWALPKFIEWAATPRLRERAFTALGKAGDARAIRPLMKIADSSTGDTQEMALGALRSVLRRLGPTAVPEYVAGLQQARQMPFDMTLVQIVWPALLRIDSEHFTDMLSSSSTAARYTAGLRIGVAKEMRAVPSLFEMVNWRVTESEWILFNNVVRDRYPLSEEAQNLLSQLVQDGRGDLDERWLEPRLFQDDLTCNYSVYLALKRGKDEFLRAKLSKARPGEGRTFLLVLASLTDYDEKAVNVLQAADQSWLQSNLTDTDENVRLAAALALAIRGDASGLAATVELLRIKGECTWLWFNCYKYEETGNDILGYLARAAPRSRKFPLRFERFEELPVSSIILLVQIASRIRDEAAVRVLVLAYASHIDAARETPAMALAVPDTSREWVVKLAQTESNTAKRATLALLAKEIVEQQCGNRLVRSAGSEDLLELLRQCR
jgi:HEAT repeat protein